MPKELNSNQNKAEEINKLRGIEIGAEFSRKKQRVFSTGDMMNNKAQTLKREKVNFNTTFYREEFEAQKG